MDEDYGEPFERYSDDGIPLPPTEDAELRDAMDDWQAAWAELSEQRSALPAISRDAWSDLV